MSSSQKGQSVTELAPVLFSLSEVLPSREKNTSSADRFGHTGGPSAIELCRIHIRNNKPTIMQPFNCTSDFECPGTQVCYQGVSWNESLVCGCSFWYGWHGEECTDLGFQSYWSLSVNGFIILVAFVGIFRGLAALLEVIKHNRDGKLWNASNSTALFGTIALMSIIVWRALIMASILTPSLNDFQSEESSTTRYHRFTPGDRILTTVTVLFSTLAALNISLMWIDVANSSSRIRRRISSSFSAYRITIYCFQVIFAIVMILMMILNKPDLAVFVAYPFLLFVVVTFSVGQCKMRNLLETMATSNSAEASSGPGPIGMGESSPSGKSTLTRMASMFSSKKNIVNSSTATAGNTKTGESKNSYKKMIQLIQRTAFFTVLFLLVTISAGGVYATLNMIGWTNFVRPDSVSLIVSMNELLIVGILGSVSTIQWYCYQNMKTTVKRFKGQVPSELSNPSKEDNSFTFTQTKKGGATMQSYQNYENFRSGASSFHDADQGNEDYV